MRQFKTAPKPKQGTQENTMTYHFYGWETANVLPKTPEYQKLGSPRELYDKLSKIWSAETCAPRLREKWTKENRTLGQCSITAFLVQDIYGGKVYGIPLSDGNFHCYNDVDGCVFDLTSEQFGDRKLDYSPDNPEQRREIHFAKEEKRMRYEILKQSCIAAV